MNYLEFDFETESHQQLEQLVALLSEQDFEGFEEDDNILKAFIPENLFKEEGLSRVLDRFSHVIYTKSVIEQVNWNKRWEQGFQPVIIDSFVAIRALFHRPVQGVEHEIIITPKMSFGTGHHATTHLVIQQMRSLNFKGKSVLDFGTGTGVLAILAEKLGAMSVLAIDYDEWSITNARENIVQNKCSAIKVEIMDEVPAGETFEIVLANINLNVLSAGMPAIARACSKDAFLLFSGFLKTDESTMRAAIGNAGLKFISTFGKGDWIAIVANNPGF